MESKTISLVARRLWCRLIPPQQSSAIKDRIPRIKEILSFKTLAQRNGRRTKYCNKTKEWRNKIW